MHKPAKLRSPSRLVLMSLLGLLAVGTARAQQDAETLRAIEECGRIGDREARLDCIDAVLAEHGTPPPQSAPRAEVPPAAAEVPPPPAPPPRAAAPQAAQAPAAPAAERPSRRERREQQRAEDEAQRRAVTIVAVRVNPLGHTTFVTESGEAWVSVRTPERSYPEVPFVAEIEPGSIGSVFLRLPDRPRRLRVSLRE